MNEFLDKLWSMEFGIALLGALVGGGFTILGSWLQTRSSNRAAELVQAKANAQRGFDALTQLKVHLEIQTFQGMGTKETRAAWNREREMLVTTANSAVMLLPDEHKDTRFRVTWLLSQIKPWYGLPPWPEYKLETSLLLSEALKILGLFVRGSDAPERRNMAEVIEREIERDKCERARRELDSLLAEDEAHGLDQEDYERINELQMFLGQSGPSEAAAEETESPS
ncbi:hypothetical protein [Streptomyces aurantiogriseus]|uniref:Uncharacterized protein n=1 Tax=Streptomyces aurantiogriseus TaxID=66870 RepID=A0A918CJB8_9ACTN|nr:hypothetical protein [Streptomyces aurantiogriseus]GGR24070.1 hypothetical protein GCM10010251_45180 [Streptomyces aurantiogriseus]